MDNLLKQITEDISGIWGNKKYELCLGLNGVFTFEEKKSEEIIDGFFSIIKTDEDHLLTLRLTELNGTIHDYLITEFLIFDTLTISREGKKIHFKHIPPNEYKGEIFNPSDN